MLPETTNFKVSKIKFCVVIALFLYFPESNFKVGGSARFLGATGAKIGLNVEKMAIFPGLKQETFPDCPWHI